MRSRAVLLGLLPLAALLVLPAQGQQACLVREPVQSFTADGRLSSYPGSSCTLRTGYLTSESHLRVAPDGTVVQQPAQTVPGVAGTGFAAGAPGPRPQTQLTPSGFAVSRNGGRSFGLVYPSGLQWVASDGAIHIDSATGRLYYYALSPAVAPQAGGVAVQDQVPAGYAHLMTSDDSGRTWYHTQAPGYVESENPRFTSGPTPKGGAEPVPGERIAYWCGNTVLFAYGQRDCFRTLDGGHTWEFRSTLLRRGAPVHPECGSSEETFDATDGGYPQAGPDGTLWTLVSCGGSTYLARSTDEAATFPVVRRVAGLQELRIDSKGILYGAQLAGTKLLLSTSADQGRTWSAPVDLVAPARRGAVVGQWAFAVRGPGQVAASYLTAHAGGGWDGSVTLSRSALARRPAFVSSTVHAGRQPLVTTPQQAMDDYIDLDIGPDGSAWAAFYADCGTDPACATSPQNPMAKVGVVAHLS
jgi:hypothetical protein